MKKFINTIKILFKPHNRLKPHNHNPHNWRYTFFFVSLAIAALLLLCYFGWLMLIKTIPDKPEQARNFTEANRGAILDRKGRFLAHQLPLYDAEVLYDVGVSRPYIKNEKNRDARVAALAEILEMPQDDIRKRLDAAPPDADYVPLKRRVDISVIRKIDDAIWQHADESVIRTIDDAVRAHQVDESVIELIDDAIQRKQHVNESVILLINRANRRKQVDESVIRLINDAVRRKKVDKAVIRLINDAVQPKKIIYGIKIDPIPKRKYPLKTLASQVIGFHGEDRDGGYGIELAFNNELSGRNNNGKGSDIMLTIDADVQYILEKIAESTLERTKAEKVMLIAMEPRTGDILGSASLPGFDPNNMNTLKIDPKKDDPRMNMTARYQYEPGSVFKVFSIASLLESGAINGNSTFVCNGSYEWAHMQRNDKPITCLGSHGRVSAREIIIHSCNVGTAYASDRTASSTFDSMLRNFGFGDSTGSGNPTEITGSLRPFEKWTNRSKPTIAMGQEIAVSALQMLQAASPIANDGILVPLRIVSRVISPDGTETIWNPGEKRRVLKPETARAMRSYMADVTSNIGTGWRARVEDLSLAVKTGTAQIFDPAINDYSKTDFIASCIALLPAESPSLVLYIAIIKPRGEEIMGGRIATPPIREAAEALAAYLGILRGRNPQIQLPATISFPIDRLPALDDIVPDFSGISKRTLIPLLFRDDVHTEIYGDGWVVRQSPPPGTPLAENTVLILELE